MVPSTPAPFVAFGPLWYGQLFSGLCRALAAPWLDPWWLARATQAEGRRGAPTAAVLAPRPQPALRPATRPPGVAARQATIIYLDRERARAAARRAAAAGRPRR